ncbi:hypothetical protein LP316_12240 [Thalassotalea sp. LPB0316]|uniref:START domain-containing protein n=1 Tax=Thalassotalea sp. LPB0316 TaxID=2769490 RepID=UPI00186713AE|nr:START domain-containing protein [Thalassotalea sp. LPB0316]QOL25067.1 hypothetical protein LP316_12240 [Thalassotalea sp. LPB0316]
MSKIKQIQIKSLLPYIAFSWALISALSYSQAAEQPWKTYLNKNNIAIKYRPYQTTELLEIDACLATRGTPHLALEFLTSPAHIINWLDNVESIELIEQITPSRNILTTTFNGILLVKPRQAFVYSKIWVEDSGTIIIEQRDAGKQYSANKGYIRVKLIKAQWLITPENKSEINVCYRVVADPQGKIPQWLAGRAALSSISKTLSNVQKQFKPVINPNHH